MSEHDGGQNSNMSETFSLPRSALLADTMTVIQSCALYLLRKGKTSTIQGSRQKRQMHFRFIFWSLDFQVHPPYCMLCNWACKCGISFMHMPAVHLSALKCSFRKWLCRGCWYHICSHLQWMVSTPSLLEYASNMCSASSALMKPFGQLQPVCKQDSGGTRAHTHAHMLHVCLAKQWVIL